MNRPITLEQAFAYLDGDLNADAMQHMQTIVEECAESARILAKAQQARSLWQQAAAEDLDDLTWKRIDNAIGDHVAQESIHSAAAVPFSLRFRSWLRGGAWATVGAACALLLYITTGLDPAPMPESAPPPNPVVATTSMQRPHVGDVLTTATEKRLVQIAAAQLTMDPASVVRVAEKNDSGTVLELVAGKVDFNVAPRKANRLFMVRAGDVAVTVKGTQFTVERTSDGTVHVDVLHGLVAVQRDDEPVTMLRTGEKIARSAKTPKASDSEPLPLVASSPTVVPTEQTPEVTSVPVAKKELATPTQRERSRTKKKTPRQVHLQAKSTSKRTTSSSPTARAEIAPNKKVPAKPAVRVIEINVEEPNVTYVENEPDVSAARRELRAIIQSIGKTRHAKSIQDLRTWKKHFPAHRLQSTATYAIGYCEFKRGNRSAANRIFARLPENNRWIRSAKDFDNPPRPR